MSGVAAKIDMCDERNLFRHSKKSFDVAFKLKVIQFVESNSKVGVAKSFNID